jgi:hypothetical protein
MDVSNYLKDIEAKMLEGFINSKKWCNGFDIPVDTLKKLILSEIIGTINSTLFKALKDKTKGDIDEIEFKIILSNIRNITISYLFRSLDNMININDLSETLDIIKYWGTDREVKSQRCQGCNFIVARKKMTYILNIQKIGDK